MIKKTQFQGVDTLLVWHLSGDQGGSEGIHDSNGIEIRIEPGNRIHIAGTFRLKYIVAFHHCIMILLSSPGGIELPVNCHQLSLILQFKIHKTGVYLVLNGPLKIRHRSPLCGGHQYFNILPVEYKLNKPLLAPHSSRSIGIDNPVNARGSLF